MAFSETKLRPLLLGVVFLDAIPWRSISNERFRRVRWPRLHEELQGLEATGSE